MTEWTLVLLQSVPPGTFATVEREIQWSGSPPPIFRTPIPIAVMDLSHKPEDLTPEYLSCHEWERIAASNGRAYYTKRDG